MTDSEFLNWVADRFVHVYHESENVDFVLKLRRIAALAAPSAASAEGVTETRAALAELLDAWMTEMPSSEKGNEAQDAWADRRAAARNNARAILEGIAAPAASLREQEDAADIVAWLLSGGYSLQQRLYNDAPNAADSVAAGAWIQTVTQHLQRLAKDAKPNQLLLEHSGCGNNTQVDQLTVRLNPGDKVVLFKGPITAAIDAQRLGRGKEKTRIASTLNEGGIRHG